MNKLEHNLQHIISYSPSQFSKQQQTVKDGDESSKNKILKAELCSFEGDSRAKIQKNKDKAELRLLERDSCMEIQMDKYMEKLQHLLKYPLGDLIFRGVWKPFDLSPRLFS